MAVSTDAGNGKTYGPYSPVRVVGDWVFISGQVGIDPATGLAKDSVGEQTTQAAQNIKNLLEARGLALIDVVKTTVFLVDMGGFSDMNDSFAAVFSGKHAPTRSTVAVKELPRVGGKTTLLVEIDAIAYKGSRV
jgi:2-iminobutanoate/2-iminopropanoate deaminase